jgi:hypothetical protein
MTDEDDKTHKTLMEVAAEPVAKFGALVSELESLLKSGEVATTLAERGLNASLALCAVLGLRCYLEGKKAEAAEDFATVAEEIRSRLGASDVGHVILENGRKA